MKTKILYTDLAVCVLWIISIFCVRYYWNQAFSLFLGILVILRLTISFSLFRKEKKTWIPLTAYVAVWGFIASTFNVRYATGNIAEYLFHLLGMDVNQSAVVLMSVALWMWIAVAPIVCYLVLFCRHQLTDTGMTKIELFGSILWHDRRAMYFCGATILAFLTLNVGIQMQYRLCQIMCFIASPLTYWLICRYKNIETQKAWFIVAGVIIFWYAQLLGGATRVIALIASFGFIAYPCWLLYKTTKLRVLPVITLIYLAVLLPSFAIGYNQYSCLSFPRNGFGHLASYNGIFVVSDGSDENMIGLRDRYGLLMYPYFEQVVPEHPNEWGLAKTFLLRKEGFSYTYDINSNTISLHDTNPDVQHKLCSILEDYFAKNQTDFADKAEIKVTDCDSYKPIAHVKVSMHGTPTWIYEHTDFLPEDTAVVAVNEYLRTDSVTVGKEEKKNNLSHAFNLPNDDNPRYKVYVRLSFDRQPKKKDIQYIAEQIRTFYTGNAMLFKSSI